MARGKKKSGCPNCGASCRSYACDGAAAAKVYIFRSENGSSIEVTSGASAGVSTMSRKPWSSSYLTIRSGAALEATLYFANFEDARRLAREVLAKVDEAEASLAPGSCPSAGCQTPLAEHDYDHPHRRAPASAAADTAPTNGAG